MSLRPLEGGPQDFSFRSFYMTAPTQASALHSSPRFQEAKKSLLTTLVEATQTVSGVRPPSSAPEVREQFKETLQEFNRARGRDLYYPFLASGLGSGPFVELNDGSVKYDMIGGIGVNFFGHSHPAFMEEMINGLSADVMQGNLQPGHEAKEVLTGILSRVGEGCRLKHGWLTTCGTMANEIALKIIRQKRAPATKVLAFNDSFHGRSTAMQELTDNPKYRDGQPVYGEVLYLPFYSAARGLEESINDTLRALKEHQARYPGKIAALLIELVQGEGGFNFAPREWYVRVFEEARKANLAIWIDEVQTFGRTGELFAYQTFGLNEYVDVVTVGKLLQACAVLYTEEYNPKPGLVAGTFSGSTMALRTARRTLELFESEELLGKDGKVQRLSKRFAENFKRMSAGSCKGRLGEWRTVGAMVAFTPDSGTMDDVKATLLKLYDLGVIAFSCGHGPYLVRMLPPFGVMTEKHVDEVCGYVEQALGAK